MNPEVTVTKQQSDDLKILKSIVFTLHEKIDQQEEKLIELENNTSQLQTATDGLRVKQAKFEEKMKEELRTTKAKLEKIEEFNASLLKKLDETEIEFRLCKQLIIRYDKL